MKDSKKDKEEEPTFLENALYDMVESFFSDAKGCEKIGSDKNNPISLEIFGGRIRPDVFGVKNPSNRKKCVIYMAEGKNSFRGRNFDICKGQGISLQRFADGVYLFFPFKAWRQLDKREKSEVLAECKNLQLGLLIIYKNNCKELIEPKLAHNLLREESKDLARDKIVQYFPDYESTERNKLFFDNYYGLAKNILRESHVLIESCIPVFKKSTRVRKGKKVAVQYYYPDDEDTYEFYLEHENSDLGFNTYLVLTPFGSEDLATETPTLFVEELYPYKQFVERNMEKQLLKYVEKCIKQKLKVTIYGEKGDGITDLEPEADISIEWKKEGFEKNPLENIFVYETIEILGVEKDRILREVEKALKRARSFEGSITRTSIKERS